MKREVGLTDARGNYLPVPRQPQGKGMRWELPTLEEPVFALLFLDGEPFHGSRGGFYVKEGVLEIDWSRHDEQPTRWVNNGHELWSDSSIERFERMINDIAGSEGEFTEQQIDEFIAASDELEASPEHQRLMAAPIVVGSEFELRDDPVEAPIEMHDHEFDVPGMPNVGVPAPARTGGPFTLIDEPAGRFARFLRLLAGRA